MKTIPLKSALMRRPDGTEMNLSYWVQLNIIMRSPINAQQGVAIDEVRSSIKVIDALEAAGEDAESFQLENADFEYMCTKVKAARFAFVDQALAEFVDDVTA